jgi:hypothetical protein
MIRTIKSQRLITYKKQQLQPMTSPKPLLGTDLVDCARANAKQGIEIAAYQCGYGDDINSFTHALRESCQTMNLKVRELNELITNQDKIIELGTGEIVAPETSSQL